MRQHDPMFVQYMSRKIILSLDPPIPDPLASRDRTIHPLVEVFRFVVAVQRLLSRKQRSPGAAWLAAEVTPPLRACSWLTAEELVRRNK